MVRPRSIHTITCQNPACKYFLREDGKDIIKRGKNHAGHQRYFCNRCKTWFVETSNTPLYYKHLSKSKIIEICTYLMKKNSIRRIERITGHHRDTIGRLLEDICCHAEIMDTTLREELNVGQVEMDELWLFINKHKRRLSKTAQDQLAQVLARTVYS